jgi:putative DNA primase/helicase
MSENLQYALAYVRRGLRVFPTHWPIFDSGGVKCSCFNPKCESIGKHPLTKHGVHDASDSEDRVREWWKVRPHANIGLATGGAAGILALDVDPRHGGDDTLAALEREHGEIPPTWRFLTGGGGEHILFEHPEETVRNSAGKLGDGLDIRSDGGYIVAPPSLHASGRRYAISVDHHPQEVPLAEVPQWLLDRLKQTAAKPGWTVEQWRALTGGGVDEGGRNEAIARLAGHLLRRFIDPRVALDLLQSWNLTHCRPPLPPEEVTRTVESICAREMARRGAA